MRTQKCDESTTIDQEIRKEISSIKFESDEIDIQTVYFGLSFRRFLEEFDFFANFNCRMY
jgi:hypothetical protein